MSALILFVNPASLIIVLALPIKVGNLLSTTPFCWGVPGAVYSNWIHRPKRKHSYSKALFSPLLSNLIYFTFILLLTFRLNKNFDTTSIWSIFFFTNQLILKYVARSTNNIQCLFPPPLAYFMLLISKYINSPGFSIVYSTFFEMFFFLIFLIKQCSHFCGLPLNSIPITFAFVLPTLSPQCPNIACHLSRLIVFLWSVAKVC